MQLASIWIGFMLPGGNWRPHFMALLSLPLLASCNTLGLQKDEQAEILLKQGILSTQFAVGLSPKAQKKAVAAEIAALQNEQAGAVVNWQVRDGATGKVQPERIFEVGDSFCRRYSHLMVINGNQKTAQGTVCKNKAGGHWVPLD